MNDLISRAEAQTAIQFAARRYIVAHEAHGEGQVVWSDNLINVTDAMNVLRDVPSIQPERKTGQWILDRSGAYCCNKCMEPCATYVMMQPRDKFCKMCGAKMEVSRNEQDQ